ncbi:ATP-grasp domain-containing protein [Gammaproteobacteria bacterium]|jgi:hypothetical protein|nr:ATP-grasp domain-containing protein [Gammaproteobacteria bacterium]MDC0129899.1 ATP-grasp domain-containing protein [Gammaproteobacteria bacterium]
MKSILFLGTGHLQEHSINSAKASGYTILGVDKDPSARSAPLCDYFLNSDSTDAVTIYSWCRSIKECDVEAVWANNDILIPTRASLELALNVKVPHASLQTCFDLLSKVRSSDILGGTGFSAKQYDFNEKTLSELSYPIIVKPKKGSGSEGVKLISSRAEFEKIKFDSEREVIEDYIDGVEFGTNHFYDGKNIFKLPAVRRYFDHNMTMVPLGTVVADMNDKMLLNAYSSIEEVIISNNWLGPIKADIFLHDTSFNIIEMSPRFHGEIDTTFVFNYFGISLSDMYFSALSSCRHDIWTYNFDPEIDFSSGYISICNSNIIGDITFIENTLRSYGLKFLSFVHSGSGARTKKNAIPKSTADLVGFVFYSSAASLSREVFGKLFRQINLLKMEDY